MRIDTQGLDGLSCPSALLCVGIDGAGNVVTSRDPTGGVSAWTVTRVDAPNHLAAVSCPSVSFCAAADWAGNVVTSSDPAGGAGAWTVAQVDGGNSIEGLACPLVSFCVAVDSAGNVLTSLNPAGGASAWTVTHVDDALSYECDHYGMIGPACQPALGPVSCPSASLCVAVDDAGNIFSSTDPAAGGAAWTTGTGRNVAESSGFDDVSFSCPSTALCVAVLGYSSDVTTWNPSTGSFPAFVSVANSEYGLFSLSCPSVHLCYAFDDAGHAFSSTNPTNGTTAWTPADVDPMGKEDVSALACPSASLCEAVDASGNVIVGRPPPTAKQLTRVLSRELIPSGHAARTAEILRHGGYSCSITAPGGSREAITWYLTPTSADPKQKPVRIAAGHASSTANGILTVKIALTRKGKQDLAHAGKLKLTAKGTLRLATGAAVTVSRTFQLN